MHPLIPRKICVKSASLTFPLGRKYLNVKNVNAMFVKYVPEKPSGKKIKLFHVSDMSMIKGKG